MRHALRILTALVLPVAPTGSTPAPTPTLAWPRLIMFYGGVIEGRRYMTDRAEVIRFMSAISKPAPETREAVDDRSYVEVGLYWHNPTWEPYVADTVLLKTLPLPVWPMSPPLLTASRPGRAQPARLYLGKGGNPPLFDYFSAGVHPGLRTIDADGLEVLRNHGVPTHDSDSGN